MVALGHFKPIYQNSPRTALGRKRPGYVYNNDLTLVTCTHDLYKLLVRSMVLGKLKNLRAIFDIGLHLSQIYENYHRRSVHLL